VGDEFQIRLFGRPTFLGEFAHEYKMPTRKAEILFAMIASKPGKPIPRAELSAQLFPDKSDVQARRLLANELWRLRKVMKEQGQETWISKGSGGLMPSASSASSIDLSHFQLTYRLRKRQPSGWIDDARKTIEASNEPLLHGDNSSEWVAEQRQIIARKREVILEELMAHAVESQNPETVLRISRKLLDANPYDERAMRANIRSLLVKRNRGAAVAAFKIFQARLDQDLGVEPDEKTTKLIGQCCERQSTKHYDSSALLRAVPDDLRRLADLLDLFLRTD